MSDLSQIPTDQLLQLYQQPEPANGPLSSMSTEDLLQLYHQGGEGRFEAKRERYQTWPERLVRGMVSAAALPGEVYRGEAAVPQSENMPGGANTDNIGRVFDLATMGNPINPMVRSGDRAFAGIAMADRRAVPPSAQALKDAAEGQYKAAGEMGVEIGAPSVKTLGQGMQADLEKDGIFAELAPKTFSVLRRIQSPPDGSFATIGGLSAIRRSLGLAARDFTNKTEQLAAQRAIERLDGFLSDMPEGAAVAGPAAAAGKTLEAARGNYAAAQRSNKITGTLDDTFGSVLDRADISAATANSGQNVDNAIRQRLKDVLIRPKESAGYSPEELAQIERIARGSGATNSARFVGNALGGGGGLGAIVSGGVAGASAGALGGGPVVGGAVGVATPAVGFAAKQLANALTKRELSKLDEMIRRRSPLYQAMPKDTVYPVPQDALVRALLESKPQQ